MKVALYCTVTLIILLLHTSHGYRTVIVGAGLSGYSAAARLLERGVNDILVLEAENRIGGRVHTVPFHNGRIDMGAQWVHGQQNNIIYEMVGAHFPFGDSAWENAADMFLLSDGTARNQTQIAQLAHLAEGIMAVVYDPSYTGSFGSFFEYHYWNALNNEPYRAIPRSLATKVQHFYHTYTNNFFGSKSWFDISIEIYANAGYTLGSQWVTWRDSGFSTVFEFLSKRRPFPQQALDVESKILVNKEVTNINWDGAVITLRCADNSQYLADYVIFTGSLGVLKHRHNTLFTPTLPARKTSAIQYSDYGSLEKIFLEFSAPFWDQSYNFAEFSILWTERDIAELTGTSREWLIHIGYFRRIDAFPTLLGVFFIGARIPDFNAFDQNKIINDCHWLLSRAYTPNVPRPINAIRSNWITLRNFMGAYSLFTPTSAYYGATPSRLAEPVNGSNGRPRIFFAGEHTSQLFSGYANGAVETGYRAAAEVLSAVV
ncbi:Spermine oxidase [Pseudolycoriella hygida]|uniref:Amine oxidase n=1 Tax=Pseudolycoriella hygida TaxID=35572 RepID=A0A9Q0N0C5_9DIPT|nr:Spermine oxidase [Pseudolycoriella hygida]